MTEGPRIDWTGSAAGAGGRLRLLCFPAAGGGATGFHAWREALGRDIRVAAVRLPGREAKIREAAFLAMEELVAAVADSLESVIEEPVALYGHSLGGWVAFEVAREMRARRWSAPVRLFVAGCGAPHLSDPADPIHELPADEFLAAVEALEGIPEEAFEHPELLDLALPTLRADFTVYETYRYRPGEPLACPISALGGRQDSRVSRGQLEAWRSQTSSDFRLRMLDGGHFFPVAGRQQVVAAIREDLGPWLSSSA